MRKIIALLLAVSAFWITACARQPAQTETTHTPASQSAADDARIAQPQEPQTSIGTQLPAEDTSAADVTMPSVTTTNAPELPALPPETTTHPHTSHTPPDPQPPEAGSVPFTVHSVRVNREYEPKFVPGAVVAENTEQLRDAVAFAVKVPQDDIAAYTDEWFGTHRLIVVALQESSGSNRHDVRKVSYDEDGAQVTIKRLCPDVSTCDVAHWLLFIELADTRLHGGDPVELTIQ